MNETETAATAGQAAIPDDRRDWLERRRAGIGGSDAAAILGLHWKKSAYTLWAEKAGLIEIEDDDLPEHVEWGNVLEPIIRDRYRAKTGRTVTDRGRFTIDQSTEYPHMLCTLDGDIEPIEGKEGAGVLECKNVSGFKLAEWFSPDDDGFKNPDPPISYQVQIQHNMIVTGRKWGSFACLFGGNSFKVFDVDRNDDFCELLIREEETFWKRVQNLAPPAVDGSSSTTETLKALFRAETGEIASLPEDAFEWDRMLQQAKEELKKWAAVESEQKNRFIAAIGNAAYGATEDRSLIYSLKSTNRQAYQVQAASYRTLRKTKRIA